MIYLYLGGDYVKISIFAQRLKKERESKGWTQEYLADLLKIKIGTLSGYERSYRQPDLDMVIKIAEHLDCSVDYLLGRTNQRSHFYEDREPTKAELEEILKNSNVMFDGAPLDDIDKEDLIDFVRIAMRTLKVKRQQENKQDK